MNKIVLFNGLGQQNKIILLKLNYVKCFLQYNSVLEIPTQKLVVLKFLTSTTLNYVGDTRGNKSTTYTTSDTTR